MTRRRAGSVARAAPASAEVAPDAASDGSVASPPQPARAESRRAPARRRPAAGRGRRGVMRAIGNKVSGPGRSARPGRRGRTSSMAQISRAPYHPRACPTGRPAPMRVLVIDDDPVFLQTAADALQGAGVECATVQGAEAGLNALSERTHGSFDLVVLGVPRHGRSSWDVLMEVRELADEVPVICVTTHPPDEQAGHALELGSDDCVAKPLTDEDLLERVRAVLQHRRSLPTIDCGDLRIDLARRRIERSGNPIHLAPREYDLLLALVRAEGKALPREDLV